ncbi:MAG: rod shape-determining protein MreD [Acidobacteriota bacterium]
MKYLFLPLLSFVTVIAQMVAGSNFYILNFLDLSLILIAYWAVYHNRTQALFVGSVTGLLLDAAMMMPLGYNGFGKTLAAFILGQAWKRFNTRASWVQFVIVAVSSAASSMSVFVLSWIMQRHVSRAFLGSSLIQAVVTSLVTIIVLGLLKNHKPGLPNKAR